jgi:raffinose/stachyose/melibiose transport system permease protein
MDEPGVLAMNATAPRRSLSAYLTGSAFLAVAVVVALLPIALVLMNAFKPHGEIIANPLAWPTSLASNNFKSAWIEGHFTSGLGNSILICASTILVTVSCAAMAAYPLARRKIRFWQLISLYFLCAVTVPIQLFLFPLFYIYAIFGLVSNAFATSLILAAINLPLAIFLLRTYILNVPVELENAALMDGAGPWKTFWYVILPIIRPGLITVALLVGFNAWNEFMITSTFQQGQAAFTMTLDYLSMNSTIVTDRGLMMAGALIIVFPILVFFLFMQRFFIAGMTAGAVKG